MTITVTRSDWEAGICGHPGSCAIALAIKRTFPGARDVIVTHEFVYYVLDNVTYEYAANTTHRNLMRHFDNHLAFPGPTILEYL